ncbi:chromosomal replication initiator protein DnaA [Candidatus Berkelbacteria bacterium CG10_big_fil_rev_8_21_14_0_10_43_13]|uniref:Chromosomal replication initiator protein DnaA n=1 Tax=Candidatus Berkelbacteria bacterium CG10_big_fil_rev_8_21_14_0_10_43_13 TaxID=1974514 RepID=A0A2H0W9R1_9BACT|nr:MAG: chromosomal replication initiator protein DnaA [Candidatus Berkelbacteria bacterium CG10_big_fil_rev_8_21_14_0_10_43_13]
MDLNELWRSVLGELQVTLSKANFETWFKNTFIFEQKKNVFTIGVPTFFVEDWLKKKYIKELERAIEKQTEEKSPVIKFKIASPQPDQVITFAQDKLIHKPVEKPAHSSPQKSTPQTLPQNTTLSDNYVFENFIVGPSNQLAHAAAIAVAASPGLQYNPLYIYGESGLGKTHLIQAVGHELLKKHPNKKVLYVSTETFINDFIQAVGQGFGKAKDFKTRYRNVDLLLIDDIQFLSSKEGTQDEFFHTFNHLYQNKKQVILTSDRTPKDIKGLEVRLKTRFEGGMVCDISQPDLETREAILRHKAIQLKKEVADDVISYIASSISSSVRELEGALNKVLAACSLTKCDITLDKTKEILSNMVIEKQQTLTPDVIIREVHKFYNIPIEDLLGPKRTKEFVSARHIVIYLLRHLCNLSYPEIGRKMGGKDHSTIMHGCKKIETNISSDLRVKEDLTILKDRIYSSVS